MRGAMMDVSQLPDLSDWRFVEVWTLEEAAMLWAAIDPLIHHGKRIAELQRAIHETQYRKALLYLRAATEAVCAGTLPFTEAWEDHLDDQGNSWSNKIAFPKLPEPIRIAPQMTRVKQAAFIKWAQSKCIPSYRRSLQLAQPTIDLHAMPEPQKVAESVLLLAKPSALDESHPCHSVELRAGIEVWEGVVATGAYERGKSPKTVLLEALDAHPRYSQLSTEAKTRISTVANWSKTGGAPKTPTKANPPTLGE